MNNLYRFPDIKRDAPNSKHTISDCADELLAMYTFFMAEAKEEVSGSIRQVRLIKMALDCQKQYVSFTNKQAPLTSSDMFNPSDKPPFDPT